MKSINLLNGSWVKAILFCTASSTKLISTMDFAISQCIYVKKAATKLKSSGCCRALNFNCFIALLLAWENSFATSGNISLGFKLMLGTSCPGIFGPLLAALIKIGKA